MHEKGVIHRDLNPTNVFLVDNDFIKLLDFNVSKMIDE
jgi:serine/threonine protein kinase